MISTVEDAGTAFKATLADGTILWIPKDPLNADYVRVENWIAAGGTVT